MTPIKPTEDIQPLTRFRANVSSFVEQVRTTRRPLILTQRGRAAAVLLGASDYEALLEELEVLRDIHVSEKQLAEGRSIPHGQVVEELRALIGTAPNAG